LADPSIPQDGLLFARNISERIFGPTLGDIECHDANLIVELPDTKSEKSPGREGK